VKALHRATHDEIIAGVGLYAFSRDKQYIPHARTWLHQSRWEGAAETSVIPIASRSKRAWMVEDARALGLLAPRDDGETIHHDPDWRAA
jgi:hypothetical protein